jgi:hypothetical protein
MAQCKCWTAAVYRDILGKRQSPKSLGARREDSQLLLDFASPTQALTKVRVRIANLMFLDYLAWHRIEDKWLITSTESRLTKRNRTPEAAVKLLPRGSPGSTLRLRMCITQASIEENFPCRTVPQPAPNRLRGQ